MRIETRQMYRTNGLIDDFVLFGKPEEYVLFASLVEKAITSKVFVPMLTESEITIQIYLSDSDHELFTSLQNDKNDYYSMEDWNNRNYLRVFGCKEVLLELSKYLMDLSARGDGYSYISEYSNNMEYSTLSPEWRLHVDVS